MPDKQTTKKYDKGYSKGTKWAENVLLEIYLDKMKALEKDNENEDYREAFRDAVTDVFGGI